jgi:peptidoglycan/LPS O-acetylase OafA/YrhL
MSLSGKEESRYQVLDGWRGISILAVLACHLLPLGPKSWTLNASAGLFGMAVFFCLSGFLITGFLLKHGDVRDFLVRRLCRIVPLSWLALPIGLLMAHAPLSWWAPNFLFVANYPPFWLTPVTAHFWSLCVEVQFYAVIALVYGFFGRRGLQFALPGGALLITALRIHGSDPASIVTYLRADEILAGGILALICRGELGPKLRNGIAALNPFLLLALFAASTLQQLVPLQYLRPYFSACLVGCTLLRQQPTSLGELQLRRILSTRSLAYVAEISYALYIIHPLLIHTWLGSGSKLVMYAKRPLLLAACFGLAHASTFWYEKRWIAWGRRLSAGKAAQVAAAA